MSDKPNFRKSSSMDDFERYAKLLNGIGKLQSRLLRELAGDVPKSVYHDGFDKMDDGTKKLRSDLENRMAREHPDEWDMDVFYGNVDETEVEINE